MFTFQQHFDKPSKNEPLLFVNFWLHPRAPFPCGSRVFPKMCSRLAKQVEASQRFLMGLLNLPIYTSQVMQDFFHHQYTWHDLDRSWDTGPPTALQWCWGRDESSKHERNDSMTPGSHHAGLVEFIGSHGPPCGRMINDEKHVRCWCLHFCSSPKLYSNCKFFWRVPWISV